MEESKVGELFKKYKVNSVKAYFYEDHQRFTHRAFWLTNSSTNAEADRIATLMPSQQWYKLVHETEKYYNQMIAIIARMLHRLQEEVSGTELFSVMDYLRVMEAEFGEEVWGRMCLHPDDIRASMDIISSKKNIK